MKKFLKAASVILIVALLFCFWSCGNAANTPDPAPDTPASTPASTPSTPSTPASTPASTPSTPSTVATPVSGIFSEGNAFYMNVEADNGPSSGNGAW